MYAFMGVYWIYGSIYEFERVRNLKMELGGHVGLRTALCTEAE